MAASPYLHLPPRERRPSPSLRPGSRRGQGLTEYLIVLVGLAIVSLAVIVSYGGKLQGLWGTADDQVTGLASGDLGGAGGSGGGAPLGGSGSSGSPGSGAAPGPGGGGFGGGSAGSGFASGSPAGSTRSPTSSRRADRRGDGIVRPSRELRRGRDTVGDGADRITVVAPSRGRAGSAAGSRRSGAVRAARSRQSQETRWDRRRLTTRHESGAAQGLGGGRRVISFLGFVIVALLAVGLAVIGRVGLSAFGGRGS